MEIAPTASFDPSPREALNCLERGLDALEEAKFWSLGEPDLLGALDRLVALEHRVAALRLRVVHEVDGRGAATSAGAPSTAAYLRSRLRMRPGVAAAQVRLANALDEKFAPTAAALSGGSISEDATQVIVAAVRALPSAVTAETRDAGEAFLLVQAREHDPATLAKLGRHLLHVVDPDAGDRLAEDEGDAVQARELFLTPDRFRPGTVLLRGRLDAETAAALRTALDPLSAPRPSGEEGRDVRSPAQRAGDALSDLVRGVLDCGGLPTQGGERPHLTVTVTLETLQRRLGAIGGELDWAGPLSAESVRRLACDARVVPVVLGGAGEPLDVGRASYVVPPGMRRALVARDRGCAFPGCDRPAQWCDAHHVRHWADGGDTALSNLVLSAGTITAFSTTTDGR